MCDSWELEFLVPGQPGRGLFPKAIDQIEADTVFAVRCGPVYFVPLDGDHLPVVWTEMRVANHLRNMIDDKYVRRGWMKRIGR
jgi:hypothetical protein